MKKLYFRMENQGQNEKYLRLKEKLGSIIEYSISDHYMKLGAVIKNMLEVYEEEFGKATFIDKKFIEHVCSVDFLEKGTNAFFKESKEFSAKAFEKHMSKFGEKSKEDFKYSFLSRAPQALFYFVEVKINKDMSIEEAKQAYTLEVKLNRQPAFDQVFTEEEFDEICKTKPFCKEIIKALKIEKNWKEVFLEKDDVFSKTISEEKYKNNLDKIASDVKQAVKQRYGFENKEFRIEYKYNSYSYSKTGINTAGWEITDLRTIEIDDINSIIKQVSREDVLKFVCKYSEYKNGDYQAFEILDKIIMTTDYLEYVENELIYRFWEEPLGNLHLVTSTIINEDNFEIYFEEDCAVINEDGKSFSVKFENNSDFFNFIKKYKIKEKVLEQFKEQIEKDYDGYQIHMENFWEDFTYLICEWNDVDADEESTYFFEGSNTDWMGRSFDLQPRTLTPEEVLTACTPNGDFTASVIQPMDGSYLKFKISHHDAPMGSFYTVYRVKDVFFKDREDISLISLYRFLLNLYKKYQIRNYLIDEFKTMNKKDKIDYLLEEFQSDFLEAEIYNSETLAIGLGR